MLTWRELETKMTILKYDLNKIAAGDETSIYADPNNRWDAPSIYIQRPYRADADWTFKISHSSSSSGDYGVDAILKAELLRLQLADIIETMRELMTKQDELKALREAHAAAQRAEWEAKVAAAQAKKDADTKLSPSQIGLLLAETVVQIKHAGKYKVVHTLRRRGDDQTTRLVARSTCGGAVQFKLGGELYSKSKLAVRLEEFAEVVKEEVTA